MFYGIRYLVENYVSRRWTMEDIEKAAKFHKCTPFASWLAATVNLRMPLLDREASTLRGDRRTHLAPMNDEFPFPREVFERFVHKNDGGSCH